MKAHFEESGRYPAILNKSHFVVSELQKPHPRNRKIIRSRSAFVSPVR